MKTNFKRVLVIGIVIICVSLLPVVTKAQITAFGSTATDPDAPLDGGVSLLIAAGVGYGVKKANANKKKKDLNNTNC
jgi:hypothetical protein